MCPWLNKSEGDNIGREGDKRQSQTKESIAATFPVFLSTTAWPARDRLAQEPSDGYIRAEVSQDKPVLRYVRRGIASPGESSRPETPPPQSKNHEPGPEAAGWSEGSQGSLPQGSRTVARQFRRVSR